MGNKKTREIASGVALVMLFNVGCATYKDQSAEIMADWEAGRAMEAALKFGEKADKAGENKDSVVWNLEAGAAWRAAGDFEQSNRYLDAAAERIEAHESKADIQLGNEAGAMMSNQQNLPYRGKSYDKIMLHTFKAMNYLAMGDREAARPEIFRAYQRQQDAVDDNKRRIEKAMEEEEESEHNETIAQSRKDDQFTNSLSTVTAELENFKFYADYVNPFTVYLDGLYFLHVGNGGSDLERANKSFRRVIEIAGDNRYVQEDVEAAAAALQGTTLPASVYVIFETGRAASLDQIRIDIPIVITRVSYVGAAFPKLALHENFTPSLTIHAGDATHSTEQIANMDAIVALDFKNEFPVIVTKTLISAAAKATAAYFANDAARNQDAIAGLFMQIATAAAQAAVNIADTRTWSTLPKEFQVARFTPPSNGKVTLDAGSGRIVELQLLEGTVNVVHVQVVNSTSPLIVNQFVLK